MGRTDGVEYQTYSGTERKNRLYIPMVRLETLAEVFTQLKDHRDPRGKRHPLRGMLSLVFLGLLARIRELTVLERWAKTRIVRAQESPVGAARALQSCWCLVGSARAR